MINFNFLDFFKQNKKNTASIAKERLQIIVAQRRSNHQKIDYLPALQREIMEVIKKYVKVNEENVRVELERSGECSVLELNITLPEEEKENSLA